MLSCIVSNLMVTRKTTDKNEKDCISGSAVSVLILFERMSTVSPTALETYRAQSVDAPLNLPYKAFARITFFLQHTRMNLLVMNYFFAILTIYALFCMYCARLRTTNYSWLSLRPALLSQTYSSVAPSSPLQGEIIRDSGSGSSLGLTPMKVVCVAER